jgi:hypothetical protein
VTGACHWDQIGDSNRSELGGWNPQQNQYVHVQDVRVQGSYGDDWIMVAGTSMYHCGYWLTSPVFSSPQQNAINVEGDDGNDEIYSSASNGANAYFLGGLGNDAISSPRADVYIDTDTGDDYISVSGEQGGGFYWGGDDSDHVWYFGSAFAIMGCGDGTDWWIGPGTRPSDCEN